MTVTIYEEKIKLDIMGIPDNLIPDFQKACRQKFGVKPGCYDFPPDAVVDGRPIYRRKDADKAGYHVQLTLDGSQRKAFHFFLRDFCNEHKVPFSTHNMQSLP